MFLVWPSVSSLKNLKTHQSWVSVNRLPNNPPLITVSWPYTRMRSNGKPAVGQWSTLEKHVTSMNSKLKPTIWSHDTGHWIPCFERCQLTVTWKSNIKEGCYKPRLHVCQPISCSMATILHDSAAAAILHTRPRAIPLAMITTRKSLHGFLLHLYFPLRDRVWGSAWRPPFPLYSF